MYAPKYEEVIRTMQTKLMKMEYFDLKAETRLKPMRIRQWLKKRGMLPSSLQSASEGILRALRA